MLINNLKGVLVVINIQFLQGFGRIIMLKNIFK